MILIKFRILNHQKFLNIYYQNSITNLMLEILVASQCIKLIFFYFLHLKFFFQLI